MQKVRSVNFESMEKMVTGRNPFGVPATDIKLERQSVTEEDPFHTTKILCAYELIRFISREVITRNYELLNKWKVFTGELLGDSISE